jgi:hypothetical protein
MLSVHNLMASVMWPSKGDWWNSETPSEEGSTSVSHLQPPIQRTFIIRKVSSQSEKASLAAKLTAVSFVRDILIVSRGTSVLELP